MHPHANEPLEAEPVHGPGEIPLGPAAQTPPPRDPYAPRTPPAPGASPSGTIPQPGTLDYSRRGSEMWEFWTSQWWARRRNLMAAGLGLLGLGLGMAMTYWVVPGLLMGAGGFLVGLALPLRDEHADR